MLDKEDRFIGRIAPGLKPLAAVAVGRDVVYFIAPFHESKVIHLYSKAGKLIRSFEGIEGRGGSLGLPVRGKVDDEDNLWLVDSLRGVVVYNKEGQSLAEFGGSPPAREMLKFPIDIDFSGENMVYILEKERKRVSVFR